MKIEREDLFDFRVTMSDVELRELVKRADELGRNIEDTLQECFNVGWDEIITHK